MSDVNGSYSSSSQPADVTRVVVEEKIGIRPIVEIGNVMDLPDHSESVSESSSGKGKRPESPKQEIEVNQTVMIDPPEVVETVVAVQAAGKHQPTQREINILRVTPAQDADHRAALSKENFGFSMSVGFGVMGLGCVGAMVYGLVDVKATKAPVFAGGMGIAAAICFAIFAYYLHKVLKSKGIIPHTERNLS